MTDNIIQQGVKELNQSVAQILESLKGFTRIERARALLALGILANKALLNELWDLYKSGDWLWYNAKSDADTRTDFIQYLTTYLYDDATKGERDYCYQKNKAISLLAWTYANIVLLEGERIVPEYLISKVSMTRFLSAFPIWNNCSSEQERAWVIFQLARGDEIVTPLRDMVFLAPEDEAESEDESEDETKPKAVWKIDKNGNLVVKVLAPINEHVAAIRDALSNIVEWVS